MKLRLSLAVALGALVTSYSSMPSLAQNNIDTEEVMVTGLRSKLSQAGRLKDVIQKTEVLSEELIIKKNALSLSAAINNEPGVNVSNECSMCGVKRVMLNGMKGEHTTILVDGLPVHTLISGFYAVDAVATSGIERIEVARGAGASLIAPEAIGGTVNIVSKEAYNNSATFDLALGSHNYMALKSSATALSSNGDTGLSLAAQYDTQDQEDHDSNFVSEAPWHENTSLTAVLNHELNQRNSLSARVAVVNAEVFGGPVLGEYADSIGQVIAGYDGIDSEQLFEDNDVRKNYIAKAWETAEWINTNRRETYLKWLSEWSDSLNAEFAYSWAEHKQDSFYEGIDYIADDTMNYLRAKFDWQLNQQHLLSFGLDARSEQMRSHSAALENVDSYVSDSFDYDVRGLFVQDSWTPTSRLEIALALRADHVSADFIDPKKPGTEIDEQVLAPRLDLRFEHNSAWTSRFSAGRGYRAPLSFFETDHGILDTGKGYLIDVDKLELSQSFNYALSFDNGPFSATMSLAHSTVENLASLEENDEGVPVLSQLDERASVATYDLVASYAFNEQLQFDFSIEQFIYDEIWRSSYAIAPIEQRATVDINWQTSLADVYLSTVWFGARDLTRYGYEGFNIRGDSSSVKSTDAPAYFVSDLKLRRALNDQFSLYAGISNLTGYNQTENEDTPLFYDADGAYDVGYIFGPLHGREFYAGFELRL
ncbi:TonB-dependent receptor plug domain-containing protein [Agaribacterium haliotis]|uniref:TonB-dependent receptor plug domain-containing protein n=1 Tax=Agaribacterium haliotis TaxID=2013869 RepID=UPI000BB5303C|nr:TonB-dependent receptor [Agaribacterium haliotis]